MTDAKLIPATGGKDLISFDKEKLDIIKGSSGKELSDLEFTLFISVAKARGLDPVLNQIHAVKRKDGDNGKMMTIQVGIDGFRLIASRTGNYCGIDETVFTYSATGKLDKAKVKVYKFVQGKKCGFTATVKWEEFYPGEKMGFMWRKMPETMLEKCCEAKALRKAFPSDLSGLYIPEEISERDTDQIKPSISVQDSESEERTKKVDDLLNKFRQLGVSEKMIRAKYELDSDEEIYILTDDQLRELHSIGSQIVKEKKPLIEFFKN